MEIYSWTTVWAEPGKEFNKTKLEVLEGAVPKSLNGALYRNGPGRLERGGVKNTHWFDGDGAILGVWFKDGEVQASYKYV
jgi:all-trans-8'-apo-beta-carotenal 15,15'-oxygenase